MSVLFLPFITCIFWIVLNPFLHKKDKRLRTLQLLLAVTGISTLAMAGLANANGSHITLPCFFIRQFFTPLIISSAIIYIHAIEDKKKIGSYLLTGIAIPVSLLFAEIILLMLSGIDGFNTYLTEKHTTLVSGNEHDNIWQFIHFCSIWVFYGIIAIETVWFMIYTKIKSDKDQYTIHKYTLWTLTILYMVTDVFSNNIRNLPSWIIILASVLLSASIFTVAYASIFHNKADLTISDLLKGCDEFVPEQNNIDKVRIAAVSQIGETLQKTNNNYTADVRQNLTDEEYLRNRFEYLIVTEQLFLRQGIKISEIASMLDTNRTYISRLVNNTYNMSFSDYINTLRIEYAKQYLMLHTDTKQSDIAAICGFPNASAFNNVFKKKTGVTPRIWLVTKS